MRSAVGVASRDRHVGAESHDGLRSRGVSNKDLVDSQSYDRLTSASDDSRQ